eukprot:m.1555873 g.1555873  ORF g.1555873 m.1555873 type:complete len:304 (-) comp25270_c1_seq115:1840-2751(-)
MYENSAGSSTPGRHIPETMRREHHRIVIPRPLPLAHGFAESSATYTRYLLSAHAWICSSFTWTPPCRVPYSKDTKCGATYAVATRIRNIHRATRYVNDGRQAKHDRQRPRDGENCFQRQYRRAVRNANEHKHKDEHKGSHSMHSFIYKIHEIKIKCRLSGEVVRDARYLSFQRTQRCACLHKPIVSFRRPGALGKAYLKKRGSVTGVDVPVDVGIGTLPIQTTAAGAHGRIRSDIPTSEEWACIEKSPILHQAAPVPSTVMINMNTNKGLLGSKRCVDELNDGPVGRLHHNDIWRQSPCSKQV